MSIEPDSREAIDSFKVFNNVIICGRGLSDPALATVTEAVSSFCPNVRFISVESNHKVIEDEFMAREQGNEIESTHYYAFGKTSKMLVINLAQDSDGSSVQDFLREFHAASEVLELCFLAPPEASRPSDQLNSANIKMPFMVSGADREDPNVQPIVELLLTEYTNIEELNIKNQFEICYAHMMFIDKDLQVGLEKSYIFSKTEGLLALNLDVFHDSETIVQWLKDFPFKDQIVSVQLNQDSRHMQESRLQKISEFLAGFDEMLLEDPDFRNPAKLRTLARYVLETPGCYDLRKQAGVEVVG